MTEYIKREEALKHKRKMSGADWGGEFWDEAVLCEDIRKIPATDVVEVVRCKDCEYLMNEKGFCWCEEHSDGFGDHIVYVDADDFCSFGIKKED